MREVESLYQNSPENHESKEYSSKVVLYYIRHDKKEKIKTGQREEEISLTPEGKKHAVQMGEDIYKTSKSDKPTLAFGSTKSRAQQEAGFLVGGEDITGDESLTELRQKLDKDKGYGTRLGVKSALDFSVSAPVFEGLKDKAYDNGNGLEWMVKESDDCAMKTGEVGAKTYTKAAAAIAKDIKRYLHIAPVFDKLVKAGKYPDSMLRINGSHTSVIDCFLLKLAEKIDGLESRDQLLSAIGRNGLGFSEGYRIDINTPMSGDQPELQVSYSKLDQDGKAIYNFERNVKPELLDEIINDSEKNNGHQEV